MASNQSPKPVRDTSNSFGPATEMLSSRKLRPQGSSIDPLDYSHDPFADSPRGSRNSFYSSNRTSLTRNDTNRPVSLSINFLPSKFSTALVTPGVGRRRRKGKSIELMPKRGGGREAFRSSAERMPTEGDDDYDGINSGWFGGTAGGRAKPRMHWNRFKWALFLANVTLTIYTLVALVFCLLSWFDVFTYADILRVGNRSELVISTIAASLGLFTALVGWPGILLNNRSFLAVYTFMLWICFAFLVAPGYITYRRKTFNLEGKINAQWSRDLGAGGRLRIQSRLRCCGYFNPFVEATLSQTCYSRSILSGCKKPYLDFERRVLTRWYTIAFSIVPFHIVIMVAGLLCSNHVTYRFGKGMMPKAYRLDKSSMAVIMDNYVEQLVEHYGVGVASDVIARSRSQVTLESMPTVAYHASGQSSRPNSYNPYEFLE